MSLAAAACSGGSPGEATTAATTAPTSVTLAPTTPVDDGVLRIGVLRPSAPSTADLSGSIDEGIQLAVADIRAAAQRVEILSRPEGDPANTRAAMNELIKLGVDAIIGPMSSNVALATLATPVQAGILTCSPTASALALDDFPDNGLFFRTIPSDSLQAKAIATQVDRTGASAADLTFLDDDYGRPLADAVEVNLRARGVTVRREPFTSDESSISGVAASVAEDDATIVVLGDKVSVPAMITAATAATNRAQVPFVINDAARQTAADLPTKVLNVGSISGVSPRALNRTGVFGKRFLALNSAFSGSFAENAYDCVNLIALASRAAHSTVSKNIAAEMVAVSTGGSVCVDYATCASLLAADRNIDYGTINLAADGDMADGVFEVWQIATDGTEESQGTLSVSS